MSSDAAKNAYPYPEVVTEANIRRIEHQREAYDRGADEPSRRQIVKRLGSFTSGELRLIMNHCGRIITPTEVATAVLRFNTDGYRELGHGDNRDSIPKEHWQDIPSQHGLQRRRFVRVDAGPTWEQKHANARQDIIDALAGVRRALNALDSARYMADYYREREAEGAKPW